MLITLLPRGSRKQVLADLDEIRNRLSNIHSATQHAPDVMVEYLRWATNAEDVLSRQIQHADVDRLVPMRSRELLNSAPGFALMALLGSEIQCRLTAFNAAYEALRVEIARWSEAQGELVVLDTNVYLHGPVRLENLDILNLINTVEGRAQLPDNWLLHVVVPMVVLDELDGLKQASNEHIRWRARHTLHVLDKVFATKMVGRFRNNITIEAVLDPPGHVRLPIADDEIIDRALAIRNLAGRAVMLLTYDTGMATRARAAGLFTLKAPLPPEGDEPDASAKRGGRGRRRDGSPPTPNGGGGEGRTETA